MASSNAKAKIGIMSNSNPLSEEHIIIDAEKYRLKERNVVIVGDIHGCYDEFKQLMKDHVKNKDDLVILAGDLVNKGPKSAEMLRYARENELLAVIGNHEAASVKGYMGREKARKNNEELPFEFYKWTDALDEKDVSYLQGLPFTITIPYHKAVIVHAGLVPGVPLKEQDPHNMISMRDLIKQEKEDSFEAYEKPTEESQAWVEFWKGPEHVYFGHDAKRKLQIHDYATGLDSGCVYGGHLSAAILKPNGERSIVQIKAFKDYVPTGKRASKPKFEVNYVRYGICCAVMATAIATAVYFLKPRPKSKI